MSDPINPDHYKRDGIECIQVIETMSLCLGNAIKYIWRCDEKGKPIEDLRKAIWYLEREIAGREDENWTQYLERNDDPAHVKESETLGECDLCLLFNQVNCGFNWVATDANGRTLAFQNKPTIVSAVWEASGKSLDLTGLPFILPYENWKDSLVQRPVEELQAHAGKESEAPKTIDLDKLFKDVDEKYSYAAMDRNWTWYLYANKPIIYDDRWISGHDSELTFDLMPSNPLIDWKETLVERPKKEIQAHG